jgi:ABC-type multidrug transport system fused ATPase/permease subunit
MLELPLADPGVPDTRSPGRFLLWCARGQVRTLVTGSMFGIVWMVSQAAIPLGLGAALGAMLRQSRSQVIVWSMVVLGLGLLQAAAGILRHRRAVANFLIAASRVQQLITRRATLLGGDLARDVATGEVANIGASDVERIGDALDVIARFAGGIVSYLTVAVVLLVASPPLGAVVVLGVPVAVLAISPVLRPFERRQSLERDRRSEASSVASDTVAGLRILRGLGGEQVFAKRYGLASEEVARASSRTANLQAILDGAQVILPGAIVVAITWLGAILAVHHEISPGELVAFYASAAFLVIPMQTFVETASKWTAAVVASRRVIAILALEPRIEEGSHKPLEVLPSGPIEDVATRVRVLPGRLSVVVPSTPEEGTALLERLGRWAGGSGASTVTWGGRDVTSLPLSWYRRHVVFLERSPFHLRGELQKAFSVGAAGSQKIAAALKAAQADEIVSSLEDGLATVLPDQWRSLSGGQRQRLSLAQCLATGAEVLLLDDPTSAVDAHTEAAIAASVAELRQGQTTVICTTSPLVCERADHVIVLEDQVLAEGSHSELSQQEGRYREIVLREETKDA